MEKIALITGASKGIGREMAHVFAKKGYSLILLARNTVELEELQEEVKNKYQCSAKILSVDLARSESINIILETFKSEISRLEVLVNNAGLGLSKKFADMPQEELNSVLEVNIAALTKLCYSILPFMVKNKQGKILNVASTAGFMPGPYMSIYYASKAYVISLTKGLYAEYKQDGITVSALCPGLTKTAFHHRAQMEDTVLLKGAMPMMAAETVAAIAYEGLMKNKRIIIPGFLNKLTVFFAWLLPTFIVAAVTSAFQKPKA